MESFAPWDPTHHTTFYVIPRSGGGVIAKYEADHAFFAFHSINAFDVLGSASPTGSDEEDSIVLDMCAYKDLEIIHFFSMSVLKTGGWEKAAPLRNGRGYTFGRFLLLFQIPL